MSPPKEETRTQGSFHASSQQAVVNCDARCYSVSGQWWKDAGEHHENFVRPPNSAFVRSHALSRPRSASPSPRHIVPPIGLSAIRSCAQLVEQTMEMVIPGSGCNVRQEVCLDELLHGHSRQTLGVSGLKL